MTGRYFPNRGNRTSDGMPALYPSTCSVCEQAINMGDHIVPRRHGSGWVHVGCTKTRDED